MDISSPDECWAQTNVKKWKCILFVKMGDGQGCLINKWCPVIPWQGNFKFLICDLVKRILIFHRVKNSRAVSASYEHRFLAVWPSISCFTSLCIHFFIGGTWRCCENASESLGNYSTVLVSATFQNRSAMVSKTVVLSIWCTKNHLKKKNNNNIGEMGRWLNG